MTLAAAKHDTGRKVISEPVPAVITE